MELEMDFETLKRYKELFIESYDYSHQMEGTVWFHDVQLKDITNRVLRGQITIAIHKKKDIMIGAIPQLRCL